MTIAVIMANTDWVKANPDLVQRYMTAWLRGAREYCQAYHGAPNRQEIIDELVNSKTEPRRELLEKYPWPARSPNGKINTASMLDINAWYVTNKMSAQKFPAERVVELDLHRRGQQEARAVRAAEQGQQAAGLPRVAVIRAGEPDAGQRRGAAVEIAGLRREYLSGQGRVVAIDHVDLSVAPGEFLCIVGPSGCGKSTLLRILAGLDKQTAGTIKVDAAGWAVENAMVFQDSGLFPWMDVETNVRFGLDTRGVPRDEADPRVEAALKLVGLTQFRNHYPHQLSGGMRQRSAIARAFVTDPGMLLMDEPFAALDAQNRVILQAELVRLWEQTGKTVIYVTHSIEEALLMGDRTVIMTAQPGRIKQIIDVPFPHPRDLMQLSASAEFGKLKLDIWRVLEEEVNRARAEMEK